VIVGDPMTMNRVIHAAVRRDLGRLEAALHRVSHGDTERARQLEQAYANLHRELQHHHQSEDRIIYPYVATVAPAAELLKVMDAEHHAMAEALAETRSAMATYSSTAAAADAEVARESVERTVKVVDDHLTHEESEFEPLVWPHLETKEWKAVEKKTRATSAAEGGQFFAWLQDGISDDNRIYLRSQVPAPILFLLSRGAGRTYHRDVAPAWKE
jgi:DUF438 domain-containing protein